MDDQPLKPDLTPSGGWPTPPRRTGAVGGYPGLGGGGRSPAGGHRGMGDREGAGDSRAQVESGGGAGFDGVGASELG